MRFRETKSVWTACALVVLIAACHDSTAPVIPRTHSVTAVASIPANPTAPITIATADPESKVQLTLDVATQQAIKSLVGGAAAQVKMDDIAPADYGTLSASDQAQIAAGTNELKVLVFDITSAGASAAGMIRSNDVVAASTVFFPSITVNIVITSGPVCPAGPVIVSIIEAGVSAVHGNHNLTITAPPHPQTISGTLTFVAVHTGHFILVFSCPSVTGGIGH